jgi:ABC-2 type transport system permease protein
MPVELARRGVTDHLRALIGWVIGIVAYVALISAIFPSITKSVDLDKLLQSYPDALKSLFGIAGGGSLDSGAGFLDAELFGLMLPLLVLVLAIGSGAGTFAGEEDAGRLELILAGPVRRSSAVLAKCLGLAVEIAVVCLAAGVALAVLDPIFGLDLSFLHLAAGVLQIALVGLCYGSIALAVGAATGNRTIALGAGAGLAAAGYLVSGLHDLAGWLDPFRVLSVFWWLGAAPLQNGIRGWGVLVVLAISIVAVTLGAWLVGRRDLRAP